MREFGHLIWFLPAFFAVSILPGLCMMTALSIGMSLGFRRTAWMIAGELLGVATVGLLVGLGWTATILNMPGLFVWLRLGGGLFLIWVALGMWRAADASLAAPAEIAVGLNRRRLALQGWLTAVSNPKGWIFMASLMPPFIRDDLMIFPQVLMMVLIMVAVEGCCMSLYAIGGHTIGQFLTGARALRMMKRMAAFVVLLVAVLMLLSDGH